MLIFEKDGRHHFVEFNGYTMDKQGNIFNPKGETMIPVKKKTIKKGKKSVSTGVYFVTFFNGKRKATFRRVKSLILNPVLSEQQVKEKGFRPIKHYDNHYFINPNGIVVAKELSTVTKEYVYKVKTAPTRSTPGENKTLHYLYLPFALASNSHPKKLTGAKIRTDVTTVRNLVAEVFMGYDRFNFDRKTNGVCVIPLDGDNANYKLDNLKIGTQHELFVRNKLRSDGNLKKLGYTINYYGYHNVKFYIDTKCYSCGTYKNYKDAQKVYFDKMKELGLLTDLEKDYARKHLNINY
jgi:hypothetical protein